MSNAELWRLLTKPQRDALLRAERVMPLTASAGRQFIAFRHLASKGLAYENGHNHYTLTQTGLELALYGKQLSSVETKAERVERLYRESMGRT